MKKKSVPFLNTFLMLLYFGVFYLILKILVLFLSNEFLTTWELFFKMKTNAIKSAVLVLQIKQVYITLLFIKSAFNRVSSIFILWRNRRK